MAKSKTPYEIEMAELVAQFGSGDIESLRRWLKDRRESFALSDKQARFLVDDYYIIQENRKRSASQSRALKESGEPDSVVRWLFDQNERLEANMKIALAAYVRTHKVGDWLEAVYGIGPVIAAGLVAHIDIKKAPTVGHIWQYCGIAGSGQHEWERKTKRPWNPVAKTLCCIPGTTITTIDGPKPIEYISTEDHVLTHTGTWKRVTKVIRNDFAGEVITLRAHGLGGIGPTITPNHPILAKEMRVVRWPLVSKIKSDSETSAASSASARLGLVLLDAGQASPAKWAEFDFDKRIWTIPGYLRQPTDDMPLWHRADAIAPGWRLLSPTPPFLNTEHVIVLEDLPKLHKPAKLFSIPVNQNVARLIGLFLGDGHTAKNSVTWSFGIHEADLASFVVNTLKEEFGIDSHIRTTAGNVRQVQCGSKQLQRWLDQNVGKLAQNKKIPNGWMQSNELVVTGLLRGLFESDGHMGESNLSFATINWSLGNSVSQMLRSVKIPASATPIKTYGIFGKCTAFMVSPNDKTMFYEKVMGQMRQPVVSTAVAEWSETGAWHTARDYVVTQYAGPVYNLEVEEDHSYVANGIAVHNCYKIGDSFIKFSNRHECLYGKMFRDRKRYEIARNDNGGHAEQAMMEAPLKGAATGARPWNDGCYPGGTTKALNDMTLRHKREEDAKKDSMSAAALEKLRSQHQKERDDYLDSVCGEPGTGVPMLHPGHINDRARRYAVKQFLADLHGEWYRREFGREPPLPYPIGILGHAHLRGVA